MSAATPAPSNPASDHSSPAPPPQQDAADGSLSTDQMVLEYLRKRGHSSIERSLREALNLPSPVSTDENKDDDTSEGATAKPTVSDAELRKHLVPFWEKKGRASENALADASFTMQSLLTGGVTTPSVASLLSNIGPGGADEILSLDPTDRHEGFRDLEAWVDGSLDMYRVCILSFLPSTDFRSDLSSSAFLDSPSLDLYSSLSSAISTST